MANNKDFKVKNGIKPTAYHEGLGTVTSGTTGGNLSNISYDNKSFDVTNEENTPQGIAISSDGTKFYVIGNSNDSIFEYDLSTAYDISTATYNSVSFSVTTEETAPRDLFFKPDGTKLYIVGSTSDAIFQYALSTAWDLSTASYESKSLSVNTEAPFALGLSFKSDGTSAYVVGSTNDTVYQYNLTTPWDVSTGSYASKSFSVATQETTPHAVAFTSDGVYMYVSGLLLDQIYQYTLSTAWDVSTASYDGVFYDFSALTTSPKGIALSSDNKKMYVQNDGADIVYQFSTTLPTATLDLSTGSVFEITPTSDIQIGLSNPAASGTVSAATLLLDGVSITANPDITTATYDSKTLSIATQSASTLGMFFKPDGTEVYFSDFGSDQIDQYSLSTAWDISTATYTSTVSVVSEDATAYGVFLKDDGTKMYMLGRASGAIYQYSLSTAWDISTATYDSKSLSITGQTTSPITGLWFKSDGTACYVMENNTASNSIFQYTLSTAWDVSTGSYASKSFFINDGFVAQMWMSTDGTQVYWANYTDDRIEGGDLTTAWDISTASESYNFSFASQFTSNAYGLFISTDYDKMYILDSSADTVHQYSLALTSPTITYDTALQWGGGTAPDSPAIGETDVLTFSTRDGGTTYQAALSIDGAK